MKKKQMDGISSLKPCPFCGGQANFVFLGKDDGFDKPKYVGFITIGCQSCDAKIRGIFYQGEDVEGVLNDVENTGNGETLMNSWNRRIYK